ncbi:MAG: lactate racemase domain-containing protein [Candidatus Latescibacterota bacterium]|nr:lactate racemase domain-containing protein [Candidatus Latescibacterota bacterium]
MSFPNMLRIRQHFDAPTVEDIPAAVSEEITRLSLSARVKPGQSVAVSVGSRGINNIALITKSLVEELKALGLEPFLVPAMGSHGGGIAEAQREIIEGYGVTEEYVGAPIKASMETVQVGQTEDGVPVFFDKYAFEADHVAVVGRIKPHTDFVGEIESGLHKMMLIGLGKHKGAALYHQAIVHYSFDRIIRSVGQQVIDQCGVLLGLGIVENQYDQTALLKGVAPEEFVEREKELLVLAKKWMPRLPFDHVDLLIVDEIGKNISGAGMDTNVVGRKFHDNHADEKEYPKVTRILVRGLTPETHGNASGIGTAEYAHRRAVEEMDREITYINCMTGNHPSGAHIPLYFDTDQICIEKALQTVGLREPGEEKIMRIHNTLDLGELLVSEAYRAEVEAREDLSIVEEAAPMPFDPSGDLPLHF